MLLSSLLPQMHSPSHTHTPPSINLIHLSALSLFVFRRIRSSTHTRIEFALLSRSLSLCVFVVVIFLNTGCLSLSLSLMTSTMSGSHNGSSGGKSGASSRLQKELMELMMSDVEGISAYPFNDDIFHWVATVQGVSGTPYDGLEYQLSIVFPPNYPFEAPTVSFLTPCFHPNVDTHGAICLDILKEKWSAVYSASSVLLSIQNLLDNPNNQSPLNNQAAQMWGKGEEYRNAVVAMYQLGTKTTGSGSGH